MANCSIDTFDTFNRRINYLRISVTDKCNLNCLYCSYNENLCLNHDEILSYEEIAKIAYSAAQLGVRHIRLTGGEPLMRPQLANLVGLLTVIPGIDDISLTTNAILLKDQANDLKQAGLKRINISLDTLISERFTRITGGEKLAIVLEGIDEAHKIGFTPVKINVVVMPGINDDEIRAFALKAKNEGWHIRFIEYMPFKRASGDEVITVAEIKENIEFDVGKLWPCCVNGSGPANYFSFGSGPGTVGFIRPVSHRFCGQCNRLRLTADGKLRPCLLDNQEMDIKAVLRNNGNIEEIKQIFHQAIMAKPEHHNLEKEPISGRQMRQIGG